MSNNPPNPIHSHPEGPPEALPLREYLEGRLSRLSADSSDRTQVLREMYDREMAHIIRLFEAQFAAHTTLIEQRFTAQDEAVEKALTAQKEAVNAALVAVARESAAHAEAHEREHRAQAVAIDKAEKRADERFEEGNQFRKQIESERMTYARIDMLNVIQENARTVVEKLDADIRVRMEKLESDARNRLEKVEGDLRQRIEVETQARNAAIQPLSDWRQRSSGQIAVWIGLSGVALAVIIFLANWVTQR